MYGKHVEGQNSQSYLNALNDKNKQLENLNTELGLSKSQLISQSSLNEKLNLENNALKKQIEAFVKKNNLKIISMDGVS